MSTDTLYPPDAGSFAFVQRGGINDPNASGTLFGSGSGNCNPGRQRTFSFTDTVYSTQVGLFRFNTASIGTVISAELALQFFNGVGQFSSTQNYNLYIEKYDAFDGSVASSDWTQYSTADVGMLTRAQMLSGVDLTIALDPADINVGGFTGFRLHVGASMPPSNGNDQYALKPWNDPAGPRLIITHVTRVCHVVIAEIATGTPDPLPVGATGQYAIDW